MDSREDQRDRRTLLRSAGSLLLGLGLAGCTTPGGGDDDGGGDTDDGGGDTDDGGEGGGGGEGEDGKLRRPARS